ncbi:MAG: GTPase ObgE [Deltaproteobacteria bacterium]|nr:GTPase ObgE [Deltaproteobacteria bacterium]
MKFVDYAKVEIRSGKGGNGCCSFRREKFIPFGGPDGGNGGDGGAVYVKGSTRRSTLLDFKFKQHFHAGTGGGGMGKDRHGKRGDDLVLELPLGTTLKDAETDELLMEVMDETPRLLMTGGRGGRGNATFRSSTNRVPMESTPGEDGQLRWVILELKLMADVGLVGYPNVGKSTFISRISKARPKIADYPFTTLVPNLGVVQGQGYSTFVVADIPGIIQGAHDGVGLGLQFLRHIERTALLLLMLDVSGVTMDPWEEYQVLLSEMEQFSAALLNKPRLVALTKMDLVADETTLEPLKKQLAEKGETVFALSAVSGKGVEELVNRLAQEVAQLREKERAQQDQQKSGESGETHTLEDPSPGTPWESPDES